MTKKEIHLLNAIKLILFLNKDNCLQLNGQSHTFSGIINFNKKGKMFCIFAGYGENNGI